MESLKRSTHTEYWPTKHTARAEPCKRVLLGEDAAEERHVGPQLLGQGVQAGEGPEVDHAIGGLGAVLDGDIASCRNRGL